MKRGDGKCGAVASPEKDPVIASYTSTARHSILPRQHRPVSQHRSRRALAFSPAHIAAVKAASPVVDVIGQHVDLRRQGKNFPGPCPWHDSKSKRSFIVSPEYQTWKCWGCNIGGDVFAFVRKYFNVTFPDAVAYLARRAGIDLSKAPSREMVKQVELRVAAEENRARLKEMELAEVRRIGGELADARRLYRAASTRLAWIEGGAPERFDDERDACFAAIALAADELRELDASYCVVSFGKSDLRERFISRPEDRATIIAEVLETGFVETEKGFRHRVAVQ